MKKLLMITALICANVAPAHAISETYRRQLEREHKTQLQDAHAPAANHASSGHATPFVKHFNGVRIERDAAGIVKVDEKLAALDESEPTCSIYKAGSMTIMVYKNGKVAVLTGGQFAGYAK